MIICLFLYFENHFRSREKIGSVFCILRLYSDCRNRKRGFSESVEKFNILSELGDFLIISFSGYFSAIFYTAPVISVSSFRDVKGVGVVSAVSAGPSASIVQGDQSFQNIIVTIFHLLFKPCVT